MKYNIENINKKVILFGSGEYGKKALDYLGADRVAYFCDNDPEKVGTFVNEKEVISFDQFLKIYSDYLVIISVYVRSAGAIAEQLKSNGVSEFITYIELVNNYKKPEINEKVIDWQRVSQKAKAWIYDHSISQKGVINTTETPISYPEVTGYYIPTLIKWGFRDLAVTYTEWLCSIQKSDGSWCDTFDKDSYVFDSAQILKGLLSVRDFMPKVDEYINRGCRWIMTQIEDSGRIPRPEYADWGANGVCSELIHLYCISPLMEAAEIFNNDSYRQAAKKVVNYYVTYRREEILDFSFLSHFYAYVMESLVDVGETELAREAMSKIAKLQKEDGSIPAFRNVNWVCSTGMFQFAVVWYKLGDIVHGDKALNYAAKLQNQSGGWYGSYSVIDDPSVIDIKNWPTYFPNAEISWAVKYFFDALYYKLAASFEEQSSIFKDEIALDDGRYRYISNIIRRFECKSICDVGCGKGRYIKNLMTEYSSAVFSAVDISESVMRNISDPVNKKAGTLTNIPFKDNSFDLVYSVEALEHSILAENAVVEMLRVTKPGGCVAVIDKNKSALGMLEIDEWEQWFDDSFFENIAAKMNCKLEVTYNIPYEGYADNLFSGWLLIKEKG